ncbi:MAG TPA: PspC domain-containing protein [Acidobacterium sp.]|nr:PspC domain-containing protein [Acidobacterium sp.]
MTIYCRNCGKELGSEARFCPACGTAVYMTPPPVYAPASRLIRPRAGRMVAGVCQGLANAYVWDVAWVRVITVLLAVFGGGMGIIAYVIFWIVMPEEPLALPPVTPYPPQGTNAGNSVGGQ